MEHYTALVSSQNSGEVVLVHFPEAGGTEALEPGGEERGALGRDEGGRMESSSTCIMAPILHRDRVILRQQRGLAATSLAAHTLYSHINGIILNIHSLYFNIYMRII